MGESNQNKKYSKHGSLKPSIQGTITPSITQYLYGNLPLFCWLLAVVVGGWRKQLTCLLFVVTAVYTGEGGQAMAR